MKLTLTDDDGVVLEQWDTEEPDRDLRAYDMSVFEAIIAARVMTGPTFAALRKKLDDFMEEEDRKLVDELKDNS